MYPQDFRVIFYDTKRMYLDRCDGLSSGGVDRVLYNPPRYAASAHIEVWNESDRRWDYSETWTSPIEVEDRPVEPYPDDYEAYIKSLFK